MTADDRGLWTAFHGCCAQTGGKVVAREEGLADLWAAPLYSSVPVAAKNDSELYDLLALVDDLRVGRARERAMAEKKIEKRLNLKPAAKGKRRLSNG